MSRCEPPVAIINYHYCHPGNGRFTGLKGVTPEQFEQQVRTLQRHFKLVPLTEILEPKPGMYEKATAVITFDDGLKDLVRFALPVLQRLGVVATFFVSSGPYEDGRLLHVHRVHLLQAKLGIGQFRERFTNEIMAYNGKLQYWEPESSGITNLYPHDTEEVRSFKKDLNYRLPYCVVDEILSRLVTEVLGDEAEIVSEFYLSEDEIERCLESGLELGLHSRRHLVMSRLTRDQQKREVEACLEFCRSRFGLDRFAFSYPYGLPGSYNEVTMALLAARPEITAGLTLGRRMATRAEIRRRWEIPRLDNRDVFDPDGGLRSGIRRQLVHSGRQRVPGIV